MTGSEARIHLHGIFFLLLVQCTRGKRITQQAAEQGSPPLGKVDLSSYVLDLGSCHRHEHSPNH